MADTWRAAAGFTLFQPDVSDDINISEIHKDNKTAIFADNSIAH